MFNKSYNLNRGRNVIGVKFINEAKFTARLKMVNKQFRGLKEVIIKSKHSGIFPKMFMESVGFKLLLKG